MEIKAIDENSCCSYKYSQITCTYYFLLIAVAIGTPDGTRLNTSSSIFCPGPQYRFWPALSRLASKINSIWLIEKLINLFTILCFLLETIRVIR